MKRAYSSLSLACLFASFLLFPVVKAGSNEKNTNIPAEKVASTVTETATSAESVASTMYDSLKLYTLGMSKQALLYAYKGQQALVDAGKVENSVILTVVDFSQPSDKKRFYIIDLSNYKVLVNTYVAHGKNTGLQKAEKFSNRHESLQSSLGFYVTKGTYFGKHGLSLKLAGLEKGFNDNAESRAVVVHGATYIGDHRLGAPYMGRSFGCPAVPQELSSKVINIIKGGTTMFIYHPSQNYINNSDLING